MVHKDFTSVTEKAFTGNHRKPSFEVLVWLLPVLKLVLGHVTALQILFLVPPQINHTRGGAEASSRGLHQTPGLGTKLVLCSAPSVPQPVFTITEKAPTRAFSGLKAPTSAFTFKTLLGPHGK